MSEGKSERNGFINKNWGKKDVNSLFRRPSVRPSNLSETKI